MPENVGISRRQFLTYAALGSAAGCLDLFGDPLLRLALAQPEDTEMIYPMASNLDCGGKCFVKAHVRDGVVTRISTRTAAELNPDMPVMKCCVRGRSYPPAILPLAMAIPVALCATMSWGRAFSTLLVGFTVATTPSAQAISLLQRRIPMEWPQAEAPWIPWNTQN